jgi:hypothetical protein
MAPATQTPRLLLLMRAPVSVCSQEIFQVGDRVRAVVLSQEDYSRFSLSTAELEEQPGDMLRDKVCFVAPL